MSAPTTTPTNGAGTITATGESNGVLYTVPATVSNPRYDFGFSGTFTSAVVAVRGRIRGLTNYFPVPGRDLTTNLPIPNSGSIALTDSTNARYQFDVSACDYIEVYCVSGTPTSLGVEGRAAPAGSNPVGPVVVNAATAQTITSNSANAFAVGANGATNPVLKVNANTSSVATGLTIVGAAAAAGVALTVISSGTNENLTIDAKGSGTITLNGTGTGAVAVGTSLTVTTTSANGLAVGANGTTNPVLKVNANTASVATGLAVTGAAAAGGLAVAVISSGTNENLTINAKGSGTVTIGGVSTGNVVLGGGGGIVVVPGTLTAGGLLTCAVQVATSGPLIYSGSGAPSISAAVKGSLYLRSDGSSTSTRAYIATDTSGTWTAITTAG